VPSLCKRLSIIPSGKGADSIASDIVPGMENLSGPYQVPSPFPTKVGYSATLCYRRLSVCVIVPFGTVQLTLIAGM
jgi:hypothetical protein